MELFSRSCLSGGERSGHLNTDSTLFIIFKAMDVNKNMLVRCSYSLEKVVGGVRRENHRTPIFKVWSAAEEPG